MPARLVRRLWRADTVAFESGVRAGLAGAHMRADTRLATRSVPDQYRYLCECSTGMTMLCPSDTRLQMLAVGGMERNEQTFREMAERAGLEVVGVYPDKNTPVAIIECAPK